MALDVAGRHAEAERAYRWLADVQRPDGSWHDYYWPTASRTPSSTPTCAPTSPPASGTTGCSPATATSSSGCGRWCERAIDWVLDLQTPRGEIIWARHVDGTPWCYALLTGSSSIFHSLRCAVAPRRAGRRGPPRLGAVGRQPGRRDPQPARGLRPQAPLGHGLVLPGAGRRADRREGRSERLASRWEHVRHGRPRRALRDQRAVGDGGRDGRVRPRPPRRRRPRDGPAAAVVDPPPPPRRRLATGPGIVYPDARALPGRRAHRLHRRRRDPGRRRPRAAPPRPAGCSSARACCTCPTTTARRRSSDRAPRASRTVRRGAAPAASRVADTSAKRPLASAGR